ncbi:MAG: hypothetical protein IPM16_21055 [Chloroflexi bacterium]|nr:hypothetical protein [Chloroflexota bacterium]
MTQNKRPTLSRRASILGALVLIAAGTLVGVLLVVVLIRAFPSLEPGGQRFLFTDLDGDTFRHQPGQVRPPAENRVLEDGVRFDDADGFRRPARTADRYPVAVIGDSFTDGGQVPWTDLLAEELNAPVRNLGWSGFGPLEYQAIAEQYLADDHTWVLVAYFEGNDLSNIRTSRQSAGDGPVTLNLTKAFGAPAPSVRALSDYNDITLDPQERYLYPLDHPRPDGSTFEVAYISDYLWWLNGDTETYADSRNVQELRAALDAINAAANGACVGLIYVPNKEHIYMPLADPDGNRQYVLQNARTLSLDADGWLTHGDVAPVDWDTLAARLDNQRDVVAQVAQDSGYAFIDLVPAFQAAAAQTLTYYTYDSHWNHEGHSLTAHTVSEFLKETPCTERPF